MRPSLPSSVLLLLLVAPLAQASCHTCVEEVAEECGALDPSACAASAQHLAAHAPGLASEIAADPVGYACETLDGPGCT